ncbi:MAG: hypothetical protein ACRDWS_15050 [Acidimicrobiia bacterium]
MRRLGAAWGVLVALTLVLIAPSVSAVEQQTFYLGPDGIPKASLLLNPRGGEMPNYDPGRDVEPGLFLERSDRGLEEDEETRYQHWQIEAGGERLMGYPSLVIWSAADRFAPGKRGVFRVFLLDCDASGTNCAEIESVLETMDSGRGAAWVESTLDFQAVDHRFGEGRYLGLRIVVSAASETDMIFAYGNTSKRSRLTIYPDQAVGPVETTVAAERPLVDRSASMVQQASNVEPVPVTEEVVSVWPWLITLVLSTVALVALGALLMSSLTRPGRHERLLTGEHVSKGAQTRRISVSAR